MDHDAYVSFLIQHHDELRLPYSFATKLTFVCSPLLFGKAMIVLDEDAYEIAGVVGYVYGTGADDYEDMRICQIEVAFIQQEYRGATLFMKGLKALIDVIQVDNPAVQQVQFWTPADQMDLDRLFSHFMALPDATKSIVNDRAFYTLPFESLEMYVERFR